GRTGKLRTVLASSGISWTRGSVIEPAGSSVAMALPDAEGHARVDLPRVTHNAPHPEAGCGASCARSQRRPRWSAPSGSAVELQALVRPAGPRCHRGPSLVEVAQEVLQVALETGAVVALEVPQLVDLALQHG